MAQRYERLGQPLRPSLQDIALAEQTVTAHAATDPGRSMRALLLGVTPDVVRMPWPKNVSLVAMDNCRSMIDALWRPCSGAQTAVCGDWRTPVLRDHACDIVLGDGSLNALASFADVRTLTANLVRVLRPDGVAVLRSYIQPDRPESPAEIFDKMHDGAIASFTHLRLRLLMAVDRNGDGGVALSDVYRCWANRNHGGRLPSGPGWDGADDMIEYYARASDTYVFPNLAEFRSLLEPSFEFVRIAYGPGALADRCPAFILKPRSGS